MCRTGVSSSGGADGVQLAAAVSLTNLPHPNRTRTIHALKGVDSCHFDALARWSVTEMSPNAQSMIDPRYSVISSFSRQRYCASVGVSPGPCPQGVDARSVLELLARRWSRKYQTRRLCRK